MTNDVEIAWGRIAAMAGGVLVLYGAGRGVSRLVAVAAGELVYRVAHAIT